jgi:histidine triad (HIT) family protein
VFLDTVPAARGHTLVIPKEHYETITDTPEEIVDTVFRTVRRVAATLESVYEPDGINIVQSNGTAAGQEVPHAHVHVIPRYEGDNVTLSWIPEDISEADQQEIATRLRNELDSPL